MLLHTQPIIDKRMSKSKSALSSSTNAVAAAQHKAKKAKHHHNSSSNGSGSLRETATTRTEHGKVSMMSCSSSGNSHSNSNSTSNSSTHTNTNAHKSGNSSSTNGNTSGNNKISAALAQPAAAAASGLSKSVMGMKFMQRVQQQPSSGPVSSSSSSSAAVAKSDSADRWFRTDHFVSEFDLSQQEVPSSSSSPRSKSLIVIDKNGRGNSIEVVSAKDEIDVYARLPGRRSFNGCNRAMEKYYQQIIDAKYLEKNSRMEQRINEKAAERGDLITDEDMAEHYEELIGLPRGPNQGRKASYPKGAQKDKKKHNGKR